MDISIIIPAYNCAKYLNRCIKSVLEALNEYDGTGEIIIVDNNSTDKTYETIKELQKKQPKLVKAEQCKTPGAAAARNYGVKKASDEYMWFIDADDTIRKDAISRLTDVAKENDADLVMLGMERIYTDGHTDYLSAVCPKQENYKSRFVRYGLGPVQVLIRRQWWLGHKLAFNEGMIHEDMELMSALILYTDKFACVDEPLYYYYQNSDSVLHKSSWDAHYLDIFPVLKSLHSRFEKAGATKKYHDELEWFFIWNLLIDSAKDFSKFPEGREGFQRIREILEEYYPNWRKNRFLKEKPLKLRLRVRMNYYKN